VKTLAFILLISLSCYGQRRAPDRNPETDATGSLSLPSKLDFEKDIQPILQSHCTPCHFKDGKMYQRMPFDQSKTLVDFQEGILRRLKNEEELKKVRAFLAQMK
jgi:hypothetical protein